MSKKPKLVHCSSVSEDAANQSKSHAMAFSFRELATATNHFRRGSFIGEGSYGPVYKGKIEGTGQARPFLNDRKNCVQLADPQLEGQFQESMFCEVIDVVLMCVRDDSPSRPTMTQVVVAMDYLTSK
ncbi:serine/threonine-protein kinase PBS1-like [Olea europaea var. sylvestris]|uniref:serine/threonine-protein kinase PBS1-like n=1 Tax=Olea europaea var. sylvestris TaxID=158386 RepID=UPI000C1CF60C|nr:serine/threonine-protein kinase PBS1-like [Olea europaea var. sylvestris]